MDPLYVLPCLLVSGFTSDFRFYDHYTTHVHILPFHLYSIPHVSCSYLIILSLPCLISFAVYLLAPTCLCSRHSFQCMFMIQNYRYTCVYLCSPLGIRITTRRGVLPDSPGSSCSGDSPGSSCSGIGAWSLWILPVADQSGATEAWISSRPSRVPSFQAP